MNTLPGWMAPITSPAYDAYGTLTSSSRGVISGSAPIVMPRYRGVPSSAGSATVPPSATMK